MAVVTTRNGFRLNFVGGLTAIAQRWVIEAFESCTFAAERLDAAPVFLDGESTGGGTAFFIDIGAVTAAQIPNFGKDFVSASPGLNYSSGIINLWDGLAVAAPPFGGRRFFKETVLHGLGHIVGETLGYSRDAWKRYECLKATYTDVIRAAFGTGLAWRFYEDDFIAALPWDLNPKERFAEVFKDTFGLPSARRFLNRAVRRPSRLGNRAIWRECMVNLPINYIDFIPHTSTHPITGAHMQRSAVAPFSLGGNCSIGTYPCADPCGVNPCNTCCFPCGGGGLDPDCPPDCDANYQTGPFCADGFAYPCEAMDYIVWGIRGAVPWLPFCRRVSISMAPVEAEDGDNVSYLCGTRAQPIYIPEWFHTKGTDALKTVSYGAGFYDGPLNEHDPFVHSGSQMGHEAVLDVDIDAHADTGFSITAAGRVQGWVIPVLHEMTAYADPAYRAAGGKAFIQGAYALRAPSVGSFVDPYADLSLDAMENGARRTGLTAGAEGVVADLINSDAVAGATWEPDLRVEGG